MFSQNMKMIPKRGHDSRLILGWILLKLKIRKNNWQNSEGELLKIISLGGLLCCTLAGCYAVALLLL